MGSMHILTSTATLPLPPESENETRQKCGGEESGALECLYLQDQWARVFISEAL